MRYKLLKEFRKRFMITYKPDYILIIDINTLETRYSSSTRDAFYNMLLMYNDKDLFKRIITKKNWSASHLRRNE